MCVTRSHVVALLLASLITSSPPHSKKNYIYIPLSLLLPICKFFLLSLSLFFVGCIAIFRWLVNFCCIYYFGFRFCHTYMFHFIWFDFPFFRFSVCHFRLFLDFMLHCRTHCVVNCVNLWRRIRNIFIGSLLLSRLLSTR